MAVVPDVHDLLHWANRSEVAREITRRGYRVSVETLNRWHRDRKEVPAVVEHIVFDLFGVETHRESPPALTEGLGRIESKLDAIYARQELVANGAVQQLIEALAPLDVRQAAARVIERLEALPPPADEDLGDPPGEEGPDATGRPDPEPETRRGRRPGQP